MDAIIIKDLTKKFDNFVAVNNLNLNIKKGELFSLLGVNGAGKSTTIKMLTGLIKPTSGDAFLNNYSIKKDINEIKKIVNVSPQETAVALNLTVLENLNFMAGVYSIKDKENTIKNLISDFKLEGVVNKKAKTLSGGYQRRLSIAMALLSKPSILFLDEPTLGLDVIARRELWNIINKLKGNVTIILTTHYMEEAEALSDRVAIMVDGNLIVIGNVKEIIKEAHAKNFEDAFVKLATGGDSND